MGTDIHGQVEFVNYDRWACFARLFLTPRDRVVFDLLGLGRETPALVPTRGLPNGYDKTPLKDGFTCEADGADARKHSWVTAIELEECLIAARKIWSERNGENNLDPRWWAILAMMNLLEYQGNSAAHSARFVFWFDNI